MVTEKRLFIGELALEGSLRSVPRLLSYTQLARDLGFSEALQYRVHR